MKKMWARVYLLLSFIVLGYIASPALAQQVPQSANYRFVESSLGGTGFVDSQSAHYRANGSGGILGVGDSASTGFQIKSGNQTTNDPSLSFAITSPNASFGSFSPATTATATSTFQVADYTSYGYIVQVVGTAPKGSSHTLTAMSSTGPSQAGVEQFGINLVANTSPNSFGANPDHGQFGVGSAADNYATPNNYRFVDGETIATGPKSSGITTYTISYIVNVNTLTPGGEYKSNQTLICTGTY